MSLSVAEHDPLVGEDELPGEDPDHERDEERQQHQEEQRRLVAPAVEGDPVGDRVHDDERDHRRGDPVVGTSGRTGSSRCR